MGAAENHAISADLHAWLREHLAPSSTILELGSGAGTAVLAERYRMVSIEHDPRWIGQAPSTYIHAPIEPFRKPCAVFPRDLGWYSRDVLRRELPAHRYDLILVDGPPNTIGRGGFYKWRELFHLSVPIVIDDIQRERETVLIRRMSNHLHRPYLAYAYGRHHFGILLP